MINKERKVKREHQNMTKNKKRKNKERQRKEGRQKGRKI
jgi:hypothetical protein